jgi:spermidine/putrescine transport system permease protein
MSTPNSLVSKVERFAHNHGDRVGRVTMVLVLFYLWAPMFILVLMSFAANGVLSFPPTEFTLDWYVAVLHNEAVLTSLLTSLKISIPVTFVIVTLSILLAYSIARYEFSGKGYVQILATLPLIVPLVIGGVALILFFGLINMETGYWTVFFAHVVRALPFAALIVISTFLTFDRTLEEASMDLGADEARTFRKVTFPEVLPGIVAGGLLAFTISFNEFVYTFFVKDSTTGTLPIYIWERVRYGVTPQVNVISVLFIVVATVLVLIAVYFTRVEKVTGRG